MNNNYHTQMDKQNILNEVAANNQLFQQPTQPQMQNFAGGTPINKTQPIPPAQQMYPPNYNQYYSMPNDQDEIELSEPKPTPPKHKPRDCPEEQIQAAPVLPVVPLDKQPARKPMVKYVSVPAQESMMTEYLVIPVSLIVVFTILVHPTTSKYLDKYLPSGKGLKGVLIRGAILAIVYIIIRYFTGNMTKSPVQP